MNVMNNRYFLLIIVILFAACQQKNENKLGHTQAVLNHKKALKLHQYLQKEITALTDAQKNIPSAAFVSNDYSPENTVLEDRLILMEDFKKLLRKQEEVLANQKNLLNNSDSKNRTIQRRESEHQQIREELKSIKIEVLDASFKINRLMAAYQQIKEKLPKLASN